jgi:hypothetical protein
MKQEKDAYEGEWDFDGACAPNEDGTRNSTHETFSLGCFQWVRRGKDGRGEGLKKGKVQYRIKGNAWHPAKAYQEART